MSVNVDRKLFQNYYLVFIMIISAEFVSTTIGLHGFSGKIIISVNQRYTFSEIFEQDILPKFQFSSPTQPTLTGVKISSDGTNWTVIDENLQHGNATEILSGFSCKYVRFYGETSETGNGVDDDSPVPTTSKNAFDVLMSAQSRRERRLPEKKNKR